MRRLTVEHRTQYHYAEPVHFGQHRLMLRPRDSHGLRLHSAKLTLSPTGNVRYVYDIFGNSIALVDFHTGGTELLIESVLELDVYSTPELDGLIDPAAVTYPFVYSSDDRFDASQMVTRHYADDGEVKAWVSAFVVPGRPVDTLDLLNTLNAAVHERFTYNARYEEGTQPPAKTLALGSGTCRDFALLFIEAVRELGFAARFVTGYLYTPHLDLSLDQEFRGAGATHAWAEVYLPGAGWIAFDPTNALVGTDHLVRVAVVRDPRQASPIGGTFSGSATAFLSMDVAVFVSSRPAPPWPEPEISIMPLGARPEPIPSSAGGAEPPKEENALPEDEASEEALDGERSLPAAPACEGTSIAGEILPEAVISPSAPITVETASPGAADGVPDEDGPAILDVASIEAQASEADGADTARL
ncbi:transglutaminase family protein [Aquabacter sp. L1I39]|uniref:transglutaminase-like domain-containing protein n=1 Tax=Aquabacter sp. L1I39 TaxID=2820278 RepID=UPI001ADD38DB|nr:transglutaminase family protein [Aquabacter sp. L1I39]QTL03785.1 transglutaminase family protein [Aquabacter sp. L1I39]